MSFSRSRSLAAAILVVVIGACSPADPLPDVKNDTATVTDMSDDPVVTNDVAPPAPADPVGRWTGVEGTYLIVKRGARPGTYRLTMQWSLDDKGSFDGVARGDTIEFDRGATRETLRPTNGDATGLKYLAGKKDCLTVKVGEGYCRE